MSNKIDKLEQLYAYILLKGFNHSIEEMAIGLNITPTTLYNRYQNRENLEKVVMQFWRWHFKERFIQKIKFANNTVEKILYFIHEIKLSKNKEHFFFEKETKSKDYYEQKESCNFFEIAHSLVEEGIQEELFEKNIEIADYTRYFIFNVVNFILFGKKIKTEYIKFLLKPILSNAGREKLKNIDIELFFTERTLWLS